MTSLRVSTEYGILIRRHSLEERGVHLDTLLREINVSSPLDINRDLISFGPSFGEEALRSLIDRLERLGFKYFDDFFDLSMDHPNWCSFQASFNSI